MKTSPKIKIAMTAIPPTAPPTIAPMGNEAFAAGAGVGVAVVDVDEVVIEEVLVDASSPLSALVMMLETACVFVVLVTVAGS